jgi:phage tail sheath protein FI
VSASQAAFIGFTEEGPINEPIVVTSWPDFEDKCGSFTPVSLTPTHAYHFFAEGGTTAQIVRVVGEGAADGETASGDPVVTESLTTVPVFDGTTTDFTVEAANALGAVPVAPGSVALTTAAGSGSENFSDNGDGTLTGTGGGTGTVDYQTGDITLSYAVGPDGGLTLDADYREAVFTFRMKWPGDVASEYSVVISGDPLFEDEVAATFSRYVLVLRRTRDGVVSLVEQYESLVFDDATHNNYVASVVNDDLNGSKVITCIPEGENTAPAVLSGESVAAEVLAPAENYDGIRRAFSFTFARGVSPTTLLASFALAENDLVVGAGDGTDSPVIALPGAPVQLEEVSFTVSVPQTTASPASEVFTSDGNGTGTLTGDAGGAGTIDPLTGAVTVTMGGGDTSLSAANITAAYRYEPHVLIDDGVGGVSIQTGGDGPTHWTLDNTGSNSIAYGTPENAAVMQLTWRNTITPTRGPTDSPVTLTSTADYFAKASVSEVAYVMVGGADGAAITRANVSAASLAGAKEGLYALNKTDDVLGVNIPDFETDPLVSTDLLAYVDTRNDRFAVISVPAGLGVQDAISYKKTTLNKNTNRAAMYYPHVKITDPITGFSVDVPAGGHVLGIYARTDAARNVAKAPAGTDDGVLRTAIGIERLMANEDIGQLNPNHICCLADDKQKGRVVWGARTLEQGGEFPYIQMRRLFMFMEKSIEIAMYRYVFESNTVQLRGQIISEIDTFMLGLFNSTHFSGESPADAYYVVDKTTSTDVALGVINIEVGAAPTRPAEFISVTFRQKQLSNA